MIFRVLSVAVVCLLWGIASPPDRIQADEWVAQLLVRNQPKQPGCRQGTRLSLSDSPTATTVVRATFSDEVEEILFHDSQHSETEVIEYPSCVSHDPGKPGKPRIQKPGDVNKKNNLSKRYCLRNCERAGHPHEIAWWADCAINKNYSAAFIGGGTPWVWAYKTRSRAHDEGTWGMDYDGIFKPRRVWLSWSCDREQGGLGSYATDGAPAIVERLKK